MKYALEQVSYEDIAADLDSRGDRGNEGLSGLYNTQKYDPTNRVFIRLAVNSDTKICGKYRAIKDSLYKPSGRQLRRVK